MLNSNFTLLVLPALVVLSACTASSGPALSQTANPPVATDYQVGPGDRLEIFVWENPEVSTSIVVRPDGKISTPLVEDLPAVGKTPSQLARDIELALSEYIRTPIVTVIVTDFLGEFDRQIRVVGQAAQPQSLSYRENMTLLDVMIEVGGLSELAAGNRAMVIRTIDGQAQEIRVRIDDLLNKGRLQENIRMLPGDVLTIPESRF